MATSMLRQFSYVAFGLTERLVIGLPHGEYKILQKINHDSVTKFFVKTDRVQDYHDMLSLVFKEMHHIRQSSGIRLTLDFGEN